MDNETKNIESSNSFNVIGLDIGGTKCALSLSSGEGALLYRVEFPTFPDRGFENTWDNIRIAFEQIPASFKNLQPISAIGVSCGALLSCDRRKLLWAPNLPSWSDISLADLLESYSGVPAFMENDANACALAEYNWGAGKNSCSMIFLTFGTGMGSGIILNGKLFRGHMNLAGEIGHIRMEMDGPIGYGKRGSLEGFVSGGGIPRLAKYLGIHRSGFETTESIVALARSGEPNAVKVITISSEYLGKSMNILSNLFDPDKIVIGSVYYRARDLFEPGMRSKLNDCFSAEILPSGLGEKLGDAAAANVAIEGLKTQITKER